MRSSKVSIIIPCYNNSDLLSKMIDCILRQTYSNWELIVVDDCSTDNTQTMVRKYQEKDARIKYIIRDKEPKGAQTCRNIGMNNATGEYMVIFDADDLITDTCIEKRVKFIKNNPQIDYASFPAMIFYNEEHLPTFFDKGRIFGVGNDNTDILSSLLKSDYSVIVWTNIYRTTSISNLYWDEKVKVYQDFDFVLSGVIEGLKHKFSDLNEIDYYYRVGNGNTISSDFVSQEKCDSTIYLFSKILSILKLRSDYKKRKREFRQYIILHFERLIVDGERKKVYDYLKFINKNYGFLYVILLFISKIALSIKNRVLRELFLHIQTFIFFAKKDILYLIWKHFKPWVVKLSAKITG